MTLRFRKSIKLAPGLRMNFGLKSMSMSVGPRGSSINIGSRGTHANLGLPGTGLSTRTRLGGGVSQRRQAGDDLAGLKVSFRLQDDGTVDIVAADGSELPPRAVKMAREQNEEFLRNWLMENCENWNRGIDALLSIHFDTPPPGRPHPKAQRIPFATPRLVEPALKPITLLARIFASKRERITQENEQAQKQHNHAVMAWTLERDKHELLETDRVKLFRPDASCDAAMAQDHLTDVLGHVEWPRETIVALEVNETVSGVLIDVDLPEIQNMPDKVATVAGRGLKLNIKKRSDTQRRREYMIHVHGVAFRIIGEVFAALPCINVVVVSGFSQRPDRGTGHVSDEYLFSIRVGCSAWMALNFSGLRDIDLPSCLGKFGIRRNVTATGVFKPIEPYASIEN